MIYRPDEKQKRKMQMDGSVLKYMDSAMGAGKGLTALGVCLLILGGLLAVAMRTIGTAQMMVGIAMAALGLILMLCGTTKQKKRMSQYLDHYAERSAVPREELSSVEAELQQPDAVFMAWNNGTSVNDIKNMGFVTKNYMMLPKTLRIYHLKDIVICFQTNKFVVSDGGYGHVFFMGIAGEPEPRIVYDISEKQAADVIQAITEKNPMVITHRNFEYQGQTFDALKDLKAVMDLHQEIVQARQAEAGKA